MVREILMPALSPTMEKGKVGRWVKKEGDSIKSGDIIAEIETDKAIMEWEATEEGILGKIIVEEGTEDVEVNKVIGLLMEEGESKEEVEKYAKNMGEVKENTPEVSSSQPQPNPALQQHDYSVSSSNNIENNSNNQGLDIVSYMVNPYKDLENIDYSSVPTKKVTVREALNQAMCEEMRRDSTVFLIGEEVGYYQGAYKISQGMLDEFGTQRVIDTPITEYGFTGIGVGAAFSGLKPIVEYMTFNFAIQALDHIINSAAKGLYMSGGNLKSPMVFRGINGAGTRTGAQHSQCFASWFAHCPGLVVIAPYSAEDAKGLLKSAIRDPNPVVFLEHEVLYSESFNIPDVEDLIIPIGKAKIEKSGNDITVISYSIGVHWVLKAVKELEDQGISVEVVNLRTLRPLDISTIVKSVIKTNRVVVVEEGWAYAGIGSEICAIIMEHAFDYLDAPILRVCGEDVPMPYASNLEKMALLSTERIIDAVKKVCYKK